MKRKGEAGRIVHVFSVHTFNKGDVVVLVGKPRELCWADELEKGETCMMPTVDDLAKGRGL